MVYGFINEQREQAKQRGLRDRERFLFARLLRLRSITHSFENQNDNSIFFPSSQNIFLFPNSIKAASRALEVFQSDRLNYSKISEKNFYDRSKKE